MQSDGMVLVYMISPRCGYNWQLRRRIVFRQGWPEEVVNEEFDRAIESARDCCNSFETTRFSGRVFCSTEAPRFA